MIDGKKLPIIAITASNVIGERGKCLNSGMNDFIIKPFKEETILSTLDKWVKRA